MGGFWDNRILTGFPVFNTKHDSCETSNVITSQHVRISWPVLDWNYKSNTLFSILLRLFIFSMFRKGIHYYSKVWGLLRFGLTDVNRTNLKLLNGGVFKLDYCKQCCFCLVPVFYTLVTSASSALTTHSGVLSELDFSDATFNYLISPKPLLVLS